MSKWKNILNKTLTISAWVLGAAGFMVLVGAAIHKHRIATYTELVVGIDDHRGLFFVEEEEVSDMFNALYGDSLATKRLSELDLSVLEDTLEVNPFTERAEVYFTDGGEVHIDITQKAPLLRIINSKGVSYYLDENGEKMPLSEKFTARVPVATGSIGENDSSLNTSLIGLTNFMYADPFWQAQFEQVYINEDQEFELVPKLGDHIVLLGKAEELTDKFKRLMIFYKEVLAAEEESTFKLVNVKYDDQIICTKR